MTTPMINASVVATVDPNTIAGLFGKQASASSATGVGGLLSSMASVGIDMDLAFIVFSMEIQKMDQRVSDQLRAIQNKGKLRDAMASELDRLQQLYAKARGQDGQSLKRFDLLKETGYTGRQWFAAPKEPTAPGPNATPAELSRFSAEHATFVKDLEEYQRYQKAHDDLDKLYPVKTCTFEEKDGVVKKQVGGYYGSDPVTADEIYAQIKKLEGEVQKIDSDKEIAMIQLNSNINKKGQYVEWLSNMLKKSNDTNTGVIANLK